MAKFNTTDLDFILQQILQAEAGQPPVNPHLAFGLREVDGTHNSVVPGQGDYGSADQPFPTQTTQYFQTVTVNVDGTIFDANPGVDGDTMTTSYATSDPNSIVVDGAPRTISNLIADLSANNPAAVAAAQNFADQLGDGYTVQPTLPTDDAGNLFIGNITPDNGLSGPFNAWFTFFGQFFDHGLDLITKGGEGAVFIPLQPDDPLITVGPDGVAGTGDEVSPNQAFMVVTRATNETIAPGTDGILGTSDDVHQHINTVTPYVDQNQTYASDPSHQVFLRDYMVGSDGKLHSSGKLLQHVAGPDNVAGTADDNTGMATWADVKANALKLGLLLTDANVGNVPLLATDAYGNAIFGPNGYVQVVVLHPDGTTTLVEGTAEGLDLRHPDPNDPDAVVVPTGEAFIEDKAFTAGPVFDADGNPLPDSDDVAGTVIIPDAQGHISVYDDELLDAHYIAGDGRVNENIALTAVHTIFHDEHNRLIDQTKDLIRSELAKGNMSFASNWVLQGTDLSDGIQDNEWNGERLFQVAKFGTETQYQHLVFEEFARKVAPTIHAFESMDIHLDAAITAEFANAVYRFGHSMLDENVPIYELNEDGTPVVGADGQPVLSQVGLIQAFTNPLLFASGGADMTAEIVQGTTHQIGSEIDEFVTGALRNNLLGQPLDLAAINIARGRDTGVAPLNLVRNEIFSQIHDTTLKPYESWDEFRQFLKHDASIINFVAAYGTHASIVSATTLEEKRAAALDLVLHAQLIDPNNPGQPNPDFDQDAFDFMHSLGAYANDVNNPLAVHAEWSTGSITGLDTVDLWIGGLAEKQTLFGGLLGTTFNFIFETQMESLQDGDRFYYLARTEGTHWLAELENNSFADLIRLNSGAKHLPGDVFLTPEYTIEASTVTDDPSTWLRNPVTGALLVEKLADGTVHFIGDDNFLGNTIVLGGTEGDDRLQAGQADDDTVWGDGGNDWIDGGNGNDFLYGGDGRDTIFDSSGDDVIHGEAGNDSLYGGIGDDLIFGGDGDDFIDTGLSGPASADLAEGGLGNDIIIGHDGEETILIGNEGDDWLVGGEGFQLVIGDQAAPTGQVPLIQGNDVLDGGANGDRMQGFSGDDIMLGLGGFDRFEGRLGFDWASWEDEEHGVSVDMTLNEFVVQPEALGGDAIRDFFIETEAASGTRFNDFIQGTNVALPDDFNELSNVNLINGLANYFPEGPVAFSDGNILFGGGGSDFLEGRAGNDILDGDAHLHVELLGGAHAGAQIIREIRYDQATAPTLDEFGNVIGAGDIDTAVFTDAFANYQISFLTDPVTGDLVFGTDGNPTLVVTHIPPAPGGGGGGGPGPGGVVNDGIDTLYNMERLQFADVTIENPFAFFVSDRVAEGTIQLLDNGVAVGAGGAVAVGDTLTFDASINDFEGVLVNGVLDEATAGFSRIDIPVDEMTFQWQYQEQAGVGGNPPTWIAIEGATGLSFTPGEFYIGTPIRVVASFTDGLGVRESIVSAPTAFVDTNPNINHAPTVETQVAQPGLPDTSATEDTPLGTTTRPGIFLPLTTVFTDDQTPSNQLVYTATLANGDPLETLGLTFTVLTDAAGLVTGGRITGTPSADFAGPIEVLVKATDTGGLSVTDDFIINVLPANDGPGDLTIDGTPEQGSTLTAVLGPDPDGPGTTPVFQWLRDGVAIQGTNATSYTLAAADVGHVIAARASYVDGQGFSEVVTSTPTDAVTSHDVPPVVVALAAEAVEDEPVVADLLAGATDPNGDPMSIVDLDASVVTAGGRTLQFGTDFILDGSELSLTAAGLAQFDSLAEGAQDSVTFNFGVSDGTAATPNTLTLTINGVNDAPSTLFVAETGTGAEDTAIAGVLLAGTDPEGDELTFSLVPGSATNGEVTINPATGEYVFTPAANFAGTASFSYVVNDGSADSAVRTVSLDVTPVNDGAAGVTISGDARSGETLTAVLGADLDGAGGPASYQWLRDGVAIDGATGSTLLLSADDVDHVISVNASYTDGQGFAEVSASAGTAPVGITLTGTNAANLLTGTGGDDMIDALNGSDVLNGLGGDDHLIGGAGTDTLDGGDGADTLDGGVSADVLHGGAGNDLLIGGATADAMFGEDGDDVFVFGFGDGADVIDGGAGFDTVDVTGTAENEVLNVTFDGAAITNFEGATATAIETFTADLLGGVDTLNYAGSAPDLVVDLSAGTASGFTSIAGIENVTGGTGSDTLTGDGGDNTLNGGAGASADTLIGGGGNDTLIGGGGVDALLGGIGTDTLNGGGGNDLLTGGADNDTIDGGGGNGDIAIFAGAIANYTFLDNGDAGFVVTDIAGTDGIDTLLNVENLQFTDGVFTLAQALEAQDQAAGIVHIHDSTPDDGTITGQVGSTLTVTVDHDYDADDLTLLYQWQASSDDGVTWTDIEGATGTDFTPTGAQIGQSLQVEVTYDFVDASYGPDQTILSDEVTTPVTPGAELLGVTSNGISGTDGNNHLRGTAADDLIDGGAGSDVLRGGAGDDVISGGAGRDLLFGDNGDDFLIGGTGNDFLNVSRGNDVVVFNAGDGHDVAFNFDATPDAAGDQDMIDLTSYDFLDLAAFQANVDITGSGCHTTITIGEDNIELIGVNHHNVTVDDFYF